MWWLSCNRSSISCHRGDAQPAGVEEHRRHWLRKRGVGFCETAVDGRSCLGGDGRHGRSRHRDRGERVPARPGPPGLRAPRRCRGLVRRSAAWAGPRCRADRRGAGARRWCGSAPRGGGAAPRAARPDGPVGLAGGCACRRGHARDLPGAEPPRNAVLFFNPALGWREGRALRARRRSACPWNRADRVEAGRRPRGARARGGGTGR